MQSRFDFRSPLSLFIAGLVLFVVFGALWWTKVYQSPRHVFAAMLANDLSTSYVTKNESQSSGGTDTLQQISLQSGQDALARSLVTVRSSSGSATTESIGTPKAAYIRYLNIQDSTKKNYKAVTNVWAKAGTDTASSDLAKLFDESLLDLSVVPVPPLGEVPPAIRAEMLTYSQNEDVFTPDYSSVKTTTIGGRKAYVYQVDIKLAPYLRLMQEFAGAYGLKDLQSVSPSDYQSAQPVRLQIAADVLSHQMLRVADSTSGFIETYTDYGVNRSFSPPTKSISTNALRSRLGSQ